MVDFALTLSSEELSRVISAVRYDAHQRRDLAKCCDGIDSLARQKADFLAEAERLDALAGKLSRSEVANG